MSYLRLKVQVRFTNTTEIANRIVTTNERYSLAMRSEGWSGFGGIRYTGV